jgi:hypothetical protein
MQKLLQLRFDIFFYVSCTSTVNILEFTRFICLVTQSQFNSSDILRSDSRRCNRYASELYLSSYNIGLLEKVFSKYYRSFSDAYVYEVVNICIGTDCRRKLKFLFGYFCFG